MVAAGDELRPRAPLFGRAELLEEAAVRLAEAAQGLGGLLTLEGPAGIGKSIFLEALAGRAQAMGFQTLLGRAHATDPPEPYGLLRDMLRPAPGGGGRPAGGVGPVPMFLVPLERVPVGTSSAPGDPQDETGLLLTRLSDPGDRLRGEQRGLHDRLVNYFREIAAVRPLLLAIDDVHLADRSSLEFLTTLLYSAGRERVLVAVTTVPPGEAPMAAAQALDVLTHATPTTLLKLRPMTEPELGEFARWLLHGLAPPDTSVRRWHAQTGGNPLFAESLVRSQAGAPTGEESREDLHRLLARQVQSLSAAERRTLAYGAVLGREFEFADLAAAEGVPEERLVQDVDRLIQSGLWRERSAEAYEFASDRVRADVYQGLSETRRGILHRKVLDALLARSPGRPASVYDRARHAYLGRDHRRSAEYNAQAAEAAAASLAFEAAAVHLERALESLRALPDRAGPQELRLLVELGRVLGEAGDLNRAEEVLEEAVQRAGSEAVDDGDRAAALLGLARVRSDKLALPTAHRLAEQALGVYERRGDARGRMMAHRVLGATEYRLGRLDAAERHQRAEVELAREHGTPAEQGHALIDLANTFISGGPDRLEEALRLYGQAAQIFDGTPDDAARARVRMNRGLLYHNVGRMPEALQDLEEAAEAAERSRSRIWIGYTQLNLAQIRAELHDPAEARRSLERALGLLEPLGDRLIAQSARMIRGMIHEEEGNLPQADADYRAAVEMAREYQLGPDAVEGLLRAARLAERRDDREDARQFLREALDLGLLKLRPDLAAGAREFARALGLALPSEPS